MPSFSGNPIWTIVMWVVIAVIAVFLFNEIVLPLIKSLS